MSARSRTARRTDGPFDSVRNRKALARVLGRFQFVEHRDRMRLDERCFARTPHDRIGHQPADSRARKRYGRRAASPIDAAAFADRRQRSPLRRLCRDARRRAPPSSGWRSSATRRSGNCALGHPCHSPANTLRQRLLRCCGRVRSSCCASSPQTSGSTLSNRVSTSRSGLAGWLIRRGLHGSSRNGRRAPSYLRQVGPRREPEDLAAMDWLILTPG